jgi:hypothetical protein
MSNRDVPRFEAYSPQPSDSRIEHNSHGKETVPQNQVAPALYHRREMLQSSTNEGSHGKEAVPHLR